MGNKLDLTNPIITWILEPDGQHAEVAAMLRDTGKRFELVVPFRGVFDKYEQWFINSQVLAINGDKPLAPEKLPNIIRTLSNGTFYTLLGCSVSGSVHAGTGSGTVVPTYVVVGSSETDFEQIHAMRSNIPGLVAWTGLSSLGIIFPKDDDNLLTKKDVVAEKHDNIEVDQSIGLTLIPNYSITSPFRKDEVIAKQLVTVETRSNELWDWSRHVNYHRALLNLLAISDWYPRNFSDLEVLRNEDTEELQGKKREGWRFVLSYMPHIDRSKDLNPDSRFLFRFEDIHEEGIRKWVELTDACQQGTTLLTYLARENRHLALETINMLAGTVLDCIGWYIVTSKHQTARMKANRQTGEQQSKGFFHMLEAIREEFGDDFPFVDANKWEDDMRSAFVGNKHGDAKGVNFQTMYDVTMQSLVVARMWVGLQLGANIKVMKERLGTDDVGKHVSRFIAH